MNELAILNCYKKLKENSEEHLILQKEVGKLKFSVRKLFSDIQLRVSGILRAIDAL